MDYTLKQITTYFILFIILLMSNTSCRNATLEEENTYNDISDEYLSVLNKTNDVILKNIDSLIQTVNKHTWQNPDESDSTRVSKNRFYNVTPFLLKQFLSKHNPMVVERLFPTTKNTTFTYYLRVNFRPSDSTFIYSIKHETFDRRLGQVSIEHNLLFRTHPNNYTKYNTKELVKEKQLNKTWTYYISNIIYKGI